MKTTNTRSNYKWYRSRKRLVNPTVDVICVVALTVILLLTGYMHVPASL